MPTLTQGLVVGGLGSERLRSRSVVTWHSSMVLSSTLRPLRCISNTTVSLRSTGSCVESLCLQVLVALTTSLLRRWLLTKRTIIQVENARHQEHAHAPFLPLRIQAHLVLRMWHLSRRCHHPAHPHKEATSNSNQSLFFRFGDDGPGWSMSICGRLLSRCVEPTPLSCHRAYPQILWRANATDKRRPHGVGCPCQERQLSSATRQRNAVRPAHDLATSHPLLSPRACSPEISVIF